MIAALIAHILFLLGRSGSILRPLVEELPGFFRFIPPGLVG
jgi:hypothetical protein